ncbi:hypothetical protein [Rhodovulum kholense]|uniref:Uncharacterized protein n=1 Tax=Rhodovulum kholense TaxID=453584 RepID=A0A8E2VJN5_9RHOB|nr:hypothetical protein [Rhodovulum kholense]PTW48337.1 hypothetical protein C8N38_10889 [Rhodovulum kholense]
MTYPWALVDESGYVLSAGSTSQAAAVPEGAVPLPPEVSPRMAHLFRKLGNAWIARPAEDFPPNPSPEPEPAGAALASARRRAIAEITDVTSALRRRYITAADGQDMLYQAKRDEAVAYLALDPEPATLTLFPLLAAEVGITASTPYELAQLWVNMQAIWLAAAAQIEPIRLTAVYTVETAATEGEIATALATFRAAIGGLG